MSTAGKLEQLCCCCCPCCLSSSPRVPLCYTWARWSSHLPLLLPLLLVQHTLHSLHRLLQPSRQLQKLGVCLGRLQQSGGIYARALGLQAAASSTRRALGAAPGRCGDMKRSQAGTPQVTFKHSPMHLPLTSMAASSSASSAYPNRSSQLSAAAAAPPCPPAAAPPRAPSAASPAVAVPEAAAAFAAAAGAAGAAAGGGTCPGGATTVRLP